MGIRHEVLYMSRIERIRSAFYHTDIIELMDTATSALSGRFWS